MNKVRWRVARWKDRDSEIVFLEKEEKREREKRK